MIHALRAMRVGRRTWKLSYFVGLSGYPSSDRIKISFFWECGVGKMVQSADLNPVALESSNLSIPT